MKSLLIIFNVAAEDDVCRLFLPYWQRSGCDLLFSSPYDAKSQLDGVLHLHSGKAMLKDDVSTWWWYQSRVLETMKAVATMPYERFIFTQYDSICLDTIPLTSGCACHVFTNNNPNYKAKLFLHPPWCFSDRTLERFLNESPRHDIQTSERGIMDRWLPWLLECADIPVTPTNPWSWSANGIDTPVLAQDCRNAIARGAKFLHGVKNAQQLAQILPP